MAEKDQLRLFEPSEPPASGCAVELGGVAVREVACRSLLNRSPSGSYSFNCYTGCEHGCVYCYARFMQRFHAHQEPWGAFVDVKRNAPEVLAGQIRRLRPGSVFTCSACDGWQRVEEHYRLTRRCCRLLLAAGFRLEILTKSELVLRDLDVLEAGDVLLGVTITTPDESQARLWEPRASPVAARLGILREAKAAGLATVVMFGPLLPGISDTPEALRELFSLASAADVDRIWTDALNPRPRVWPSIQEFLRSQRSDLLPLYSRVLFDRTYRERYLAELGERVRAAAEEAGLGDRL
jgi:DNA repair photolyase